MTECQACRDRMIEAYYGELDAAGRAAYERHLAACPACAAEFAALRETLGLMDKRERSDPGPDFWDGYWDRLSRRMLWESTGERERRPSFGARLFGLAARVPRWSYQAAGAAALLLVGIVIGSRLIGPSGRPGATTAASPVTASRPGAVVQAGDFIERSKVLLLGLVNYDPATQDAYAFDLNGKKAFSRRLAAEAPSIRNGLNGPGQRRLRELVAELEVIMMQIANLEAGQDLDGVELIKQVIDRQGLFLRIDLDRLAREAKGGPVAAPGRGSGPIKKSQA
jgi:hypothetical protein